MFSKGGKRKKDEQDFIADCMRNVTELHEAVESEGTPELRQNGSGADRNDKEEQKTLQNEGEGRRPVEPQATRAKPFWDDPEPVEQLTREVQTIKLNELVIKPATFDGVKPPPRRWIDDYERASKANGWNDRSMVKYFATFLSKAAYDWYLSMAQNKLGSAARWVNVRALFFRHFLGESDRLAVKRQIDRTFQGEKESITTFLPRMIRLYQLVDPYKEKIELVDMVREKLRSSYQDKLALHTI